MKPTRAKRATRPNPRVDKNNPENLKNQNVIEVNFSRSNKPKRVEILPRSLNQELYLDRLEDSTYDMIFALGPAGSGKTMLATLFAIKQLREGEIERIIVVRPNVATDDKDIGFLPGDIFQKMQPWVLNILDVFSEYYSQKEIVNMIEEKIIELVPVAFLRGRTFKRSIILADEVQNLNTLALKTLLTRIGEGSRMIITGDLRQSDIKGENGLQNFISLITKNPSSRIAVVNFNNSDIERHPVISEILRIYGE